MCTGCLTMTTSWRAAPEAAAARSTPPETHPRPTDQPHTNARSLMCKDSCVSLPHIMQASGRPLHGVTTTTPRSCEKGVGEVAYRGGQCIGEAAVPLLHVLVVLLLHVRQELHTPHTNGQRIQAPAREYGMSARARRDACTWENVECLRHWL